MALINLLGHIYGDWPAHHWLGLVCLVAIALTLVRSLRRRRELSKRFENFPSPPAHWFFGHVREFKKDGKDLWRLLEWQRNFSGAIPLWYGPLACVLVVYHPDYVKAVLAISEFKKEFVYSFIQPWIGEGLLVSNGQRWFRHRRLLNPGFHYDVLKPYVKLMSNSAMTMLDKWESYARSGERLELFEHVSLMTLDSILKCAFSYEGSCQAQSGTNTYIKAVYELSDLANMRFRTFPYHNDVIFYLSPHGFRFRKACRISRKHTEEVIRKRKEILRQEKEQGKEQTKRHLDFLDILLLARDETQQGLSDEDIRAEVDTFMFAGHDTTASGISFILYNLANHPEHQKLCREEVMQALEGKDTFEWDDLNKIPYTTMCVKESLRLYPTAPLILRSLTKTLTFPDGRSLPAGTRVGISIFGLHRNPTVWENPSVFDPLRFLPENVSKRSPHAFIPFSAGPRSCIGQNFAMNEMKVVVAQTLRRYQLIKEPDFEPLMIPRLVLRSLNGIYIRLKPLNAAS
ncbi:cytochrome P450 4A10-like [Neosynchiropus ocellatus]